MNYASTFARVIAAYLSTADEASGIPVPELLPRFYQDDRSAGALPCLTVFAMEREKTKSTFHLDIEIMYSTSPPTEAEDAQAEVVAVTGAIEAFIRNDAAWAAFLETEDATAIPDDVALLSRVIGSFTPITDGKDNERRHTLIISDHLAFGLP